MIGLDYIRKVSGATRMAVNTSTYGIPYNCKNWLALASVIWGNLDVNEAIQIVGGKGAGVRRRMSTQEEFILIDKVIALCKKGLTNRQIMTALNITSNQLTRAKNWGEWNSVSETCE